MGIHGSSTCPLILEDAKVPVENLLGEIGQGPQDRLQHPEHRPAQAGRRRARRHASMPSTRAARLRAGAQQFGTPHRAVRADPREARRHGRRAPTRRVHGLPDRRRSIDDGIEASGRSCAAKVDAIEEFAIEASHPQGLRLGGPRPAGRRGGADPRRLRLHRGVPGWSAPTATRGSTASSRAPTRSTGCSVPGLLLKRAMKGTSRSSSRRCWCASGSRLATSRRRRKESSGSSCSSPSSRSRCSAVLHPAGRRRDLPREGAPTSRKSSATSPTWSNGSTPSTRWWPSATRRLCSPGSEQKKKAIARDLLTAYAPRPTVSCRTARHVLMDICDEGSSAAT